MGIEGHRHADDAVVPTNDTGRGRDLFISHSSADAAVAQDLRAAFEAAGYTCWMAPEDIKGPKTWAEQILEAIVGCSVLVLVLSSATNASAHVSREVELAFSKGKPVLPIRVEEVKPTGTLQYLLALIQYVDAFPPPLDSHRDRVFGSLAAALDRPADPRAVVPPPLWHARHVRTAAAIAVVASISLVIALGLLSSGGGPGLALPSARAVTAGIVPSPTASAGESGQVTGSLPLTFPPAPPWTLSAAPRAGADGARMQDVASSADGFLAVGSDEYRGSRVGAAWTSEDGFKWSEHVISDSAAMTKVFVGEQRAVALTDDRIWVTSDGIDWSPVGPGPGPGPRFVDIVATGADSNGPAFVLIGQASAASSDAVVWTSDDGVNWQAAPTQPSLEQFCPVALASAAQGLAAIGTDCRAGQIHPVIAVSQDGERWTRAQSQSSFGDQADLRAISAGGPGFIMAGRRTAGDRVGEAIWTSADGLSWVVVGSFRPPGATEAIKSIAAFAGGYIAVGLRDPGTSNVPNAWTSPDGTAWRRANIPPDPGFRGTNAQSLEAVAARGGTIVGVGWYADDEAGGWPLVWTAQGLQP